MIGAVDLEMTYLVIVVVGLIIAGGLAIAAIYGTIRDVARNNYNKGYTAGLIRGQKDGWSRCQDFVIRGTVIRHGPEISLLVSSLFEEDKVQIEVICECGWKGKVEEMHFYTTAMDDIGLADKCPKCGASNVDQMVPPIRYMEE